MKVFEKYRVREKAIRVLFVGHDTGMWGAQRTLLTLLSSLDRKIIDPLLVVPYEGPMSLAVKDLNIPVFEEKIIHWVPSWKLKSRWKRYKYIISFMRSLARRCRAIEKIISEYEIDLVYTNTVTCIEGAIAAKKKRKSIYGIFMSLYLKTKICLHYFQ